MVRSSETSLAQMLVEQCVMPWLMAAPSEIGCAIRLALRGRTRPRPFEPEGPDRVRPVQGRCRKPHTGCSAHDQNLTHSETLLAPFGLLRRALAKLRTRG